MRPTQLASFASLAVLATALLVSGPAAAAPSAVALGEVSSAPRTVAAARVRDAARSALDEVDDAAIPRAARSRRAVVSVALERLDASDGGATAEVSAVVRDARQGKVLAILKGRALVEGAREQATDRALRVAMSGAFARLGDALR